MTKTKSNVIYTLLAIVKRMKEKWLTKNSFMTILILEENLLDIKETISFIKTRLTIVDVLYFGVINLKLDYEQTI